MSAAEAGRPSGRSADAVVRFSDAHKPEEIGAATTEFLVAGPFLAEIRRALAGEEGRQAFTP